MDMKFCGRHASSVSSHLRARGEILGVHIGVHHSGKGVHIGVYKPSHLIVIGSTIDTIIR